MEGITKRFAGAAALDAVDFALAAGEAHALVGENGAGKSTLVKVMTGAYRRDAGAVWLDGRPVRFDTPAAAQAAGVVAVHQEVHLLRYRTVAENICLGREPRRSGLVDWRAVRAEAERALAALGPEAASLGIDPRATLATSARAPADGGHRPRRLARGAACSCSTSPRARSPTARWRCCTTWCAGSRRRAWAWSTSATASTSCTRSATA
jgi:ABC-type sugar transport system ATPase subunit